MQKVTFVMGATATGKTYFINHHFTGKNPLILNIYDYQQKAYEEAGSHKDAISFNVRFRCLLKANARQLQDILEGLKQGRDVVVEQTFFKAKRRISYIDAIRKALDVRIEIFVMTPSDERWADNIKKRELSRSLWIFKEQVGRDMEFPNPVEGFDAIYEVIDDEIILRMNEENPDIVEQARKELAEEAARIKKEDENKQKREELLESMKTRAFWHYCEVCGKKEYITAQEAFNTGWDYPPHVGSFGLLGPRTCGECFLQDTLYWRVHSKEKFPLPIVLEGLLTEAEEITWQRIKTEPESLLVEETEGTKEK